jgi:protein ImuB
MVIAARDGGAVRIAAVDAKARGLGLAPGLALADARARVPDLAVHEHEPEADRLLLSWIADWCDRYTPAIACFGDDMLVLEIAGSAHLFSGEAGLARDATARLERIGIATRLAIAGTAPCAAALARFGAGGIVSDGAERQAAASLPVAALGLGPDTTLALRRAGLVTLADLAERPRKPLAARFGRDLVDRLAGILGEVDPPLTLRRPLPDFVSEARFADPIGLADDVNAALAAIAEDLCATLEKHGQGGRIFEASFYRADGAVRRIEALSGRPLHDPGALAKLFATRLDALADPVDPGFGFDMIRLTAILGEGFAQAQGNFDREIADGEALADLIDRLTARFGVEAVERFVAEDSHVPERAARRVPAISDRVGTGNWKAGQEGEPSSRPLLLFTPPQPVETVAEVPEGPPYRFRWRRVLHEIVRSEGPERIAPEWWRGDGRLTRDYYRVEDRQGRRFWLFRHGIYGRETTAPSWYIHGLFP